MDIFEQMKQDLKKALMLGPVSQFEKRFDTAFEEYKKLMLAKMRTKDTALNGQEETK